MTEVELPGGAPKFAVTVIVCGTFHLAGVKTKDDESVLTPIAGLMLMVALSCGWVFKTIV